MKTSHLLINEPPLQVLPSLAEAIGLNEAIVIQQLHYWLNNAKVGVVRDGEKWIFNTYEEWQENFPFWSVSTIQRIFTKLEAEGLVIAEQLDKSKHDMKKFYRLNYEQLCKMEGVKMTSSETPTCDDVNKNTETTTETTTDGEKSFSDPTWDLLHGKKPVVTEKNKKAFEELDKVESLLCEIEHGLKVNLPRTTANQAAAKRILKDGRPFGQWLTWCISDEWRAAHLYLYADLDKVWREYPQAFDKTVKSGVRSIPTLERG